MNENFITTYIISINGRAQLKKNLHDLPELRINDLNFSHTRTELERLNLILKDAIQNEEEAILILYTDDFLKSYNQISFFESIFEIARNNFHALLVDGDFCESPIHITENLYLIETLKDLGGFVLLNNTFNFLYQMV